MSYKYLSHTLFEPATLLVPQSGSVATRLLISLHNSRGNFLHPVLCTSNNRFPPIITMVLIMTHNSFQLRYHRQLPSTIHFCNSNQCSGSNIMVCTVSKYRAELCGLRHLSRQVATHRNTYITIRTASSRRFIYTHNSFSYN